MTSSVNLRNRKSQPPGCSPDWYTRRAIPSSNAMAYHTHTVNIRAALCLCYETFSLLSTLNGRVQTSSVQCYLFSLANISCGRVHWIVSSSFIYLYTLVRLTCRADTYLGHSTICRPNRIDSSRSSAILALLERYSSVLTLAP